MQNWPTESNTCGNRMWRTRMKAREETPAELANTDTPTEAPEHNKTLHVEVSPTKCCVSHQRPPTHCTTRDGSTGGTGRVFFFFQKKRYLSSSCDRARRFLGRSPASLWGGSPLREVPARAGSAAPLVISTRGLYWLTNYVNSMCCLGTCCDSGQSHLCLVVNSL